MILVWVPPNPGHSVAPVPPQCPSTILTGGRSASRPRRGHQGPAGWRTVHLGNRGALRAHEPLQPPRCPQPTTRQQQTEYPGVASLGHRDTGVLVSLPTARLRHPHASVPEPALGVSPHRIPPLGTAPASPGTLRDPIHGVGVTVTPTPPLCPRPAAPPRELPQQGPPGQACTARSTAPLLSSPECRGTARPRAGYSSPGVSVSPRVRVPRPTHCRAPAWRFAPQPLRTAAPSAPRGHSTRPPVRIGRPLAAGHSDWRMCHWRTLRLAVAEAPPPCCCPERREDGGGRCEGDRGRAGPRPAGAAHPPVPALGRQPRRQVSGAGALASARLARRAQRGDPRSSLLPSAETSSSSTT